MLTRDNLYALWFGFLVGAIITALCWAATEAAR